MIIEIQRNCDRICINEARYCAERGHKSDSKIERHYCIKCDCSFDRLYDQCPCCHWRLTTLSAFIKNVRRIKE